MSRGADGRPSVTLGQHAGPRNANASRLSTIAARDLVRRLNAIPGVTERYLGWKQGVAAKPMSERVVTAFAQPIITALQQVLPKQWGLDRLDADPN